MRGWGWGLGIGKSPLLPLWKRGKIKGGFAAALRHHVGVQSWRFAATKKHPDVRRGASTNRIGKASFATTIKL